MSKLTVVRVVLLLVCAALVSDAWAARRSVRIEFGGEWTDFNDSPDIGSAGCPGTATGSPLVLRDGYTFSGYATLAVSNESYCQSTIASEFDSSDIPLDEPGLATLVAGANDAVVGIRYTFANGSPLDPSTPVRFQWAFYDFPNGVTIAALYGLVDDFGDDIPVTDASTYLREGATVLWGGDDGLDDAYFCFIDGDYVGLWSGDVAEPGSACMAAFATFFADGFE